MTHLPPKETLARAKEFLQGAEYAVENNCLNVCAICSYAALFWAALAYEGFDLPTWEHHELRSKFTEELVMNRHRYPTSFGSWLVKAFTLRNAAQYHFGHPKAKEVKRMVNHAKEFIQKIEEVINK